MMSAIKAALLLPIVVEVALFASLGVHGVMMCVFILSLMVGIVVLIFVVVAIRDVLNEVLFFITVAMVSRLVTSQMPAIEF